MKNDLIQSFKNINDSFLNMAKTLNTALTKTNQNLSKLKLDKIYENEDFIKGINKFNNSMKDIMYKQDLLKQIKELKEISNNEQYLINSFIKELEENNPKYIEYVLDESIKWQNSYIAEALLHKNYSIKNSTCLDYCIERENNPKFLQILKDNDIDLFQREKILVIKSIISFKYENLAFLLKQKNKYNKNYIEENDSSIIIGLKKIFVSKNSNTILKDINKVNTLKLCFNQLTEEEFKKIFDNNKLKHYEDKFELNKIKSLFLHEKFQKKVKLQINKNKKIIKI